MGQSLKEKKTRRETKQNERRKTRQKSRLFRCKKKKLTHSHRWKKNEFHHVYMYSENIVIVCASKLQDCSNENIATQKIC